jgi:hypothetical protein
MRNKKNLLNALIFFSILTIMISSISAISCADSDGNSKWTTGTVTGIGFFGSYSYTDYCSPLGTGVVEYTCSNNLPQSNTLNCGTDNYRANYCYDDDVYRNFSDYGCSAGACTQLLSQQKVEECEYGCYNGICNTIANSCQENYGCVTTTNTSLSLTIKCNGTVEGYFGSNFYSQKTPVINYGEYGIGISITNYSCSGAYMQSLEITPIPRTYLIYNRVCGTGTDAKKVYATTKEETAGSTAESGGYTSHYITRYMYNNFIEECAIGCLNGYCL